MIVSGAEVLSGCHTALPSRLKSVKPIIPLFKRYHTLTPDRYGLG